jgi:hypothetical protein
MTMDQPTARDGLPQQAALSRLAFAKLLLCGPLYVMLTLMVVEAALAASTTYLVIQAGRDVVNDAFVLSDLFWILGVQSVSYVVGAVSWVFAEQAGFGAFGRYMHRFARHNRARPTLLADKAQREAVEPFLTGESFHIYFELMYEVESALRVFLGLVFTGIILGLEIDADLPLAYAAVFAICIALQYRLRRLTTGAYAANQRQTNRLTAHTYTAWDNILAGNRYNYRLWNGEFKARLRSALAAQIHAIVVRQGLSTAGGIISLAVVFATIAWVATQAKGDTATLVALAATLPKQIDLAHNVLALAESMNDLLAIWTRMGGASDHFAVQADAQFLNRVDANQLRISEGATPVVVTSPEQALAALRASSVGRLQVRGGNGAGKSSMLAYLKQELGGDAFYWPTTDRLAFEFATARASSLNKAKPAAPAGLDGPTPVTDDAEDEDADRAALSPQRLGFSAGEWQMRTLEEVVLKTNARYYLMDEWDANLDAHNRARAQTLMDTLALRARVMEISHRDAAQPSRADAA